MVQVWISAMNRATMFLLGEWTATKPSVYLLLLIFWAECIAPKKKTFNNLYFGSMISVLERSRRTRDGPHLYYGVGITYHTSIVGKRQEPRNLVPAFFRANSEKN